MKPLAVVTGAANGIGKATAEYLQSNGWKILAVDRNAEALRYLIDAHPEMDQFQLDVCNESQIEALASYIETRYGAAKALVNCAGIMQNNVTPDEMSVEEHDLIWDINYRGTFLVSRALARAMREKREGSIVNIASITGLQPLPLFAYGPGKAAVVSLTASLAGHWGPYGLRVNAVAPGYVLTEQLRSRIDAGLRDAGDLTRHSALGRLIDPREIAAAVGFLVSDAASAVSGITLPVDAGWLAGAAWATYGGVKHDPSL